jgi:cell surface protein SprA
LGEAQLSGLADNEVVVLDPIPASPPFLRQAGYLSDNKNNAYNPELIQAGGGLLNPNIREIVTANSGFNVTVSEGQDYSKLENARKLNPNEYTFSPQLGYISLQQRLA